MKQKKNMPPDRIDLSSAVPNMPESFHRRISVTCETLPEERSAAPVWRIGLRAAACIAVAAALVVLFGVSQMGGMVPDNVTPLAQTELSPGQNEEQSGRTEPTESKDSEAAPSQEQAEGCEETFVREGYTTDFLKALYAEAWPFESTVCDDQGQIFSGAVYLRENSFDPYYHIDPERCGAGTKDEMIKTIRQTAYRKYDRELCPACAPERDLELNVWLNEGGRDYHRAKECLGEVMQVYTTLKNAVEVYDVPSLCRHCSGIYARSIDHLDEYIIEITFTDHGTELNPEWAGRTVYLAPDGIYHYDAECADSECAATDQLSALQEHRALPCGKCMGVYTRNLVVFTSEGESRYHARDICGGTQMSQRKMQYEAMEAGMTLCPDCLGSR